MDITALFPSVAKGRLVNLMKVRQMDGDLLRWTECIPSDRMVELIVKGNDMERHELEAGFPLGSPVSPLPFAMYTSALIK